VPSGDKRLSFGQNARPSVYQGRGRFAPPAAVSGILPIGLWAAYTPHLAIVNRQFTGTFRPWSLTVLRAKVISSNGAQ
jgi:hypothetical protein